jgi:3-phenylpropionate/trans-cinnamate dioxygenase ferredoxin subunit
MKIVGRVPLARVREEGLVRMEYPPYDVVVGLVDGAPYALEDACNHAGASLAEGFLNDGCIACPMHGYVFSLRTGKLVAPLGLCGDQRTFEAWLEGDDVVIADPFEIVVRT